MKKLILLIYFSLLLSTPAFTQVPGYMGKRFTIGFSEMAWPALHYITTRYGYEKKRSGLNFIHAINVNYVIRDRRELSVSLKFFTREANNSYYADNGSAYMLVEDLEEFSSKEYSFSVKKFRKTRFAPDGPYSKWEAMFISSNLAYDSYHTYFYDYSAGAYDVTSYSGGKINVKSLGAAYSRGRQRIYGDKIVLDFGIRVALIVTYDDDADAGYEAQLASKIARSLTTDPQLNVYVGIGFLAF